MPGYCLRSCRLPILTMLPIAMRQAAIPRRTHPHCCPSCCGVGVPASSRPITCSARGPEPNTRDARPLGGRHDDRSRGRRADSRRAGSRCRATRCEHRVAATPRVTAPCRSRRPLAGGLGAGDHGCSPSRWRRAGPAPVQPARVTGLRPAGRGIPAADLSLDPPIDLARCGDPARRNMRMPLC